MSQEARNNAARTHAEDLLACSSYVETDAGATGQQNADVLGRLIVGAHARIDELEKAGEHIGKLDARLKATLAAMQILERQVKETTRQLAEVQITTVALVERIARVEQGVDGLGS